MKTNFDSVFKTDEKKEVEGIWYELSPEAGIKVKRFGGKNSKSVQAAIAKYMKPYSSQIKRGTLPQEKHEEVMTRVFVESSMLDWKGIEIDGEVKEFNKEDALALLLHLPGLRDDLVDFASNIDAYKEDLGNF